MSAVAVPAQPGSGGAFARGRILPAAALVLLLGILTADLVALMRSAATIIPYAYSIDYGEGIVWQQMLNIVAGRGYTPIGVFPAIVYHYPPLYHLTVAAAAAATGADPLATGRTISLIATLVSAGLVGGIAHIGLGTSAGRETRRLAAVAAAMIFPACQPVAEWAPTMRVDMLACMLSLAGLALGLAALRRPRLIHLAALAFVAAVFTKQVMVAAPLALIVGLATTRPRLAIACLATSVATGLVALAYLTWATDGGYLRHIILYNINRNEAHRLLTLADPLAAHAGFLALAGLGAIAAWRTAREPGDEPERRTIMRVLGLFLAIKTAMLAMIVKSGGSTNYMIEWFAAVAVFAAIGLAPLAALATGEASRGARAAASPAIVAMLAVLAALQALQMGQWPDFSGEARALEQRLDRLTAAIRRSPAPVISDDMTLLVRAGRPVMWEPSIAAELASVGRYDERRFAVLIRAHCFSGFVTLGDRGNRVFDSRYNPVVIDAMDAAYPRRRLYAGLVLHLPPPGTIVHSCGRVG